MISYALMTSTPQVLANFLVARGIIKQVTDPINPNPYYVGVLPGLEFVEVPNRIQTDPGPPPVYDTRHAYMVKFSGDSLDQLAPGFDQWMANNTSTITAPANFTINGEPVGNALKVNGQNVWLTQDRPERFGVWQ